ncbi:hypothetical protein ACPYO6_07250 [Georgenia sp. Z1344]|uniref:hypothetical protein n=1 Tax=Georgenia sp. Z1344 TaxID=3416706 RepID=UPI003CF3FF2F
MRTTRARRALTTTAAVAALGLVLSACGGEEESEEPTEPSTSETDTQDDAESGSDDADQAPQSSESDSAAAGDTETGSDGAAGGSGETESGGTPEIGSDGDTGADTGAEAPPVGEPLTEITAEHMVMTAHMIPEGDATYAEVVTLQGDSIAYLYGDTAEQQAEVEETIELDPGTGDEIRAELVELGLPAGSDIDGPPDETDVEMYVWQVGDMTTGTTIAGSAGDAELDESVYDVLIAHVPEDMREV